MHSINVHVLHTSFTNCMWSRTINSSRNPPDAHVPFPVSLGLFETWERCSCSIQAASERLTLVCSPFTAVKNNQWVSDPSTQVGVVYDHQSPHVSVLVLLHDHIPRTK